MSDTVAVAAPMAPSRAGLRALAPLLRSSSGLVGLTLVVAFALLAIASATGLLGDPAAQDTASRLQPPSGAHWLGTDQFGRDVLARVASGVVNSALVSIVAVAFAAVVGVAGGLVSGYLRGLGDSVIGGVTNVLFAFPPLLLALTLASVFSRTWFTVAIAIAVVYTPIFVRVTRGPVLSLREIDYVSAARATGMGAPGIMLRHVLPNITGILIVQITLSLSWAVLTEASLSFLGFGTPPPAASLGSMVFDAQTLVVAAPWTMAGPGLVLILLIVGLNLLGDGLRDALDPNRKGH
ncbi:ABC transporter permease [Microbacterium marinilacus]|uniref:ABC transporter permease n=1 Tax=Microbacterium marinilacus TaxID=415209 RepID=A0ABP7B8J2_9MICO|nr:ABC transporter permease [Microbacterium marinilacus]MBY0687236.1 ABC transporter permease [Microbacterium marinilacus]